MSLPTSHVRLTMNDRRRRRHFFRDLLFRERSSPRTGQRPTERQQWVVVQGSLQRTQGRSTTLRDRNAPFVSDLKVQKLTTGNLLAQFHIELSSEKEHGKTAGRHITADTNVSQPGPPLFVHNVFCIFVRNTQDVMFTVFCERQEVPV